MENNTIATIISTRRKALGLTQHALADKLHITNKAVSKWETGEGLPDIGILKELAFVLEISIDELINGIQVESESLPLKKDSSKLIIITIRACLLAVFYLPFITIPLLPDLPQWLASMYAVFNPEALSATVSGFNLLFGWSLSSVALTVMFGLQLILLICDYLKLSLTGITAILIKVAHVFSLISVLGVLIFFLVNGIHIRIGLVLLTIFILGLSLQGLKSVIIPSNFH